MRLRTSILAGVAAASFAAGATVLVPLDLPTLSREADLVVHGVAGAPRSEWRDGVIVTTTPVSVRTAIKGTPPGPVLVRTLGGAVGDMAQIAHGEVVLREGAEVVLFLQRNEGAYRAIGMSQGAFDVRVDPATGARIAVQQAGGAAMAGPGGALTAARPLRVPLADLAARVRELAGPATR